MHKINGETVECPNDPGQLYQVQQRPSANGSFDGYCPCGAQVVSEGQYTGL